MGADNLGANEELQRRAADSDPGLSAEEKAARLRSALEDQVAHSERLEADDEVVAAPAHASADTAEHEREMLRRGFSPGMEPKP